MQHQLNSRVLEIDAFIVRAEAREIPADVRSYLARLGAVLVCGFVERSVELVILERLGSRAHERVLSYIRSDFKRGRNYNYEAIRQLLQRFDQRWCDKFCEEIERDDAVVVQLTSAYQFRNSIAHGGSNSLSLERLKELFGASKKLVDALVESTK